MKVKTFVTTHRDEWKELEAHMTFIRKHKKQMKPEDIDRFSNLYQKAAQHLSYSQTYYPQEDVTAYLNELVSSAHNIFYKDQLSSIGQLRYFFGQRFVRLLLEQWQAIVVAMVLFLIGGVAAFWVVVHHPQQLSTVLSAKMAKAVQPGQSGGSSADINASLMSASIMTNNIKVAFLAFAGGITFGILTTYLLIYNGIMMGALAGLFWHYGQSYQFWALIVPHGMVELTAIFIAGGAGLLMGYKLFVPGAYSRVYQFKTQTKRSVQLVIGTLPLFVIAGTIEGFITPADMPLYVKYIVALLTVLGLISYVIIGRARINQSRTQPTVSLDSSR